MNPTKPSKRDKHRLHRTRTGVLLLCSGLVALAGTLPTDGLADIPWPEGAVAQYRVEVAGDRPADPTGAVCAVRFFSGGLLGPQAQNIRVTDSKGHPLPLQIIYTHPLNASLVLFALQPGEETYHLFFGGSLTSGIAPTNFARGLFYETRARPEGDTASWAAIRARWAEATNSFGVALLEDTQTRCNPFEESDDHFLSRTWGTWLTPRTDIYKLGIYARDHGFLSVNGVPVASTVPDPSARTQPISDALLPQGTQQIEILQAKRSGAGVTAVSWLMPWPEYHHANLVARPIPPAWFPGLVRGLARDYTVRQQPFWAHFADFQTDLLLAADQPLLLVQFHNRTGGQTNGLRYHWDFGDGTTSSEENPRHLYVKPGRYAVTLTAGGLSRFQKIVLATSFAALPGAKVPAEPTLQPGAAAEALRLAQPRMDALDAGTLWTLFTLAEQIQDSATRAETLLRLGPQYLARSSGAVPTQVEFPVRQKLAEARAELGQWDAAVAELKQMEPKLERQRTLLTRLQLQVGRIFQRAGKYPSAIDTFARIVNDRGGDDPRMERTALIALGDCYLQQGDLAAARREYEAASRIAVGDDRTEREQAIRRGSLFSTLRQAVTELSKLAFDTTGSSEIGNRETVSTLIERARTSFENLVFEFPDARLNPDVLHLNATLLLATSQEDACRRELETLGRVDSTGRSTLRALLLQARLHLNAGDHTRALTLLDAVLRSNPEEPLAREAAALKNFAQEAAASQARFGKDAPDHETHSVFANGSFETGVIEEGKPLPFQLEWSTPSAPPLAREFRLQIVSGFGVEGSRCLKLETDKPIQVPLHITFRFPTAIGRRLFVRARVLCDDLDFTLGEVRRSSTQTENVHSLAGHTVSALQRWGWIEPITNVERWRQFSWRTGLITAGEPTGYFTLVGLLPPNRTVIRRGTRVYLDGVECYLLR